MTAKEKRRRGRLVVAPCLRCHRLTANRSKECTVCLDGIKTSVVVLPAPLSNSRERVRMPNLPHRSRCGGGYRVMRHNQGSD